MDIDNYLENHIISEQKEQYRVNSFWQYWQHRGLLVAIDGDARIVAYLGIID